MKKWKKKKNAVAVVNVKNVIADETCECGCNCEECNCEDDCDCQECDCENCNC